MQNFDNKVVDIVKKAETIENSLNVLKKYGVLVPFDSRVHAFHGRVNDTGKRFYVKPDFDNSRNKTGNNNLNAVPGLYASSFEIAKRYADIRSLVNFDVNSKDNANNDKLKNAGMIKGTPEVHRIVAFYPDLFIFDVMKSNDNLESSIKFFIKNNTDFFREEESNDRYFLKENEKIETKNAIKNLARCTSVTEIMPELFADEKQSAKNLMYLTEICEKNYKKTGKPFVFDSDLEKIIKKENLKNEKEENLMQLASSVNSYQILLKTGDLSDLLISVQNGVDIRDNADINLQFVLNFAKHYNIVGVHQLILTSKIIDKSFFSTYFFFDTSKMNTEDIVKFQLKNQKKSRENVQSEQLKTDIINKGLNSDNQKVK